MKKNGLKKIEAAILCALIISSAMSITSFCRGCDNIRESTVRLHVIANSDSDSDQALKLLVRDAILESGAEIFDGSVNADNAVQKIKPQTATLESAAREVILNNGFDYDVTVSVGSEYFETRVYGDITMPAGIYTAVKVIIGSGGGHNWWCVMFPPLCLPAAEKNVSVDAFFSDEGLNVVKSNPKYEVRFKAVEIFEKLRSELGKNSR